MRCLAGRYAYGARLEEVMPRTLYTTPSPRTWRMPGCPPDRVASLLGHESVDTTRIYTASSAQDLQQEVEKVVMV